MRLSYRGQGEDFLQHLRERKARWASLHYTASKLLWHRAVDDKLLGFAFANSVLATGLWHR